MRVIAGLAKGHKLKTIKGLVVRPTSDRVRTILFDILGVKVENSIFLDLFAGSGAVGIEALSRGAKEAVFVERRPEWVSIIHENLQLTGLAKHVQVYQKDVYKAINNFSNQHKYFDIIFLDPPYGTDDLRKTIERLSTGKNILNNNTWIIAQHRAKMPIPDALGHLKIFRTSKIGETLLSFYEVLPYSR